jgi:hypothetical protein
MAKTVPAKTVPAVLEALALTPYTSMESLEVVFQVKLLAFAVARQAFSGRLECVLYK